MGNNLPLTGPCHKPIATNTVVGCKMMGHNDYLIYKMMNHNDDLIYKMMGHNDDLIYKMMSHNDDLIYKMMGHNDYLIYKMMSHNDMNCNICCLETEPMLYLLSLTWMNQTSGHEWDQCWTLVS